MFFREIIGQERIKERLLTEAAENRIPHALLFTGTEGVGTFPLALAYARYISCTGKQEAVTSKQEATNKQEEDSCGTCPSCVKFNKLVHPDLHFVFPIVKRKSKELCNDYLTEWREFLLSTPYFNLNLWSNEIEAEKSPVIYTKESDEIRQ
jgi:DNA polymerase-3 subunit delta'